MSNFLAKKEVKKKRIAVYVPSTTDENIETDNSAQVDRVLTTLSQMFGGATATDGLGGWMSDKHGLIKEAVKIVYSFGTPAEFEQYLDDVVLLAESLKNEMGQQNISLEYDGDLYLI